jgi:hypothetical protein
MQLREENIKRIISTIAMWKNEIELRGKVNLYDSHIIAEYDDFNHLAFQVTAKNDRRRVKETIEKFIRYRYHERYHELYFFMLSRSKNYRKDFDTKGLFEFDRHRHILDFGNLIQKIYTLETSKLSRIVEFLEQETSISEEVNGHDLRISLKYYSETGLGTSFLVRLTNHSQRPITITDVFLNMESGVKVAYSELSYRYIQLSTPLPQKLEGTDFSEFLFPLYHMNELKDNKITSPLDVTSVDVIDSFEQKHRFPTNTTKSQDDFEKLKQEIQRHWEKNAWFTR